MPGKKFEPTFSAENIFNQEWREAQFDTESRREHAPGSVSEIHYIPGTPRFLRTGFNIRF